MMITNFLDLYYEKALKLSEDFKTTREKEWSPLNILEELIIQIGHVQNIFYQSPAINEENRRFNNLGDELSDVILQLIALAQSLNINLYDITSLKSIPEYNVMAYPVLIGQLTEAMMEKEGLRFYKPRCGFKTLDDFIKNRILRLLDITFQIANHYHLNMNQEFDLMIQDATAFLNRFPKLHLQNKGTL